jgi:hypothetical protein
MNLNFLLKSIVLGFCLASSASFEARSCSTRNEIRTLVACNSAFSFDWTISAVELPTSSIANPINNNAKPTASNGRIRGWIYLIEATTIFRRSFPNTSPTHLRYALFLPNLTISSADSSTTPIITSPAPNQPIAAKKLSQVESFEVMQRFYKRMALVHLITLIGVLTVPILFLVGFLLMPVKSKCQTRRK